VHSSGSGTIASGSSDKKHFDNYRNDDYSAPLQHQAVLVSAGLAVFFTWMLFELALSP